MRLRFLFVTALVSMISSIAVSETTPNHVFQRTESVRALVEGLNAANFTSAAYSREDVAASMPRHVNQVAHEVWRKTQLLRFMSGLPTQSLDPIPAREIKPADVAAVVSAIHAQMVELLPAYGLEARADEVSLPSGKSPTDVYANLLKISSGLDALGVPATVPNDVFQVARTVLNDAVFLAEKANLEGVHSLIAAVPAVSGKTPMDAYQEAIRLLVDLKRLEASHPRVSLKGGVVVPVSKSGQVTPADVILMLRRARADIIGVAVQLGNDRPSHIAPYQGGKTPSDVVHLILQARAVIGAVNDRFAS